MKKDIQPKYYPKAKIKCACGNTFETGSAKPELDVEICSSCHPFYTGKEKLIDTAGTIERFKQKMAKSKEKKNVIKQAQEAKKSPAKKSSKKKKSN